MRVRRLAPIALAYLWSSCAVPPCIRDGSCVPVPSPRPSPTPVGPPATVPTPAPTPVPTPTPCPPGYERYGEWCRPGPVDPPPTPEPTPVPTPRPTPKPPKPTPPPDPWCNRDGSPRTGKPTDCSTCADRQAQELKAGNWIKLPPGHPFKGITGDDCADLHPGCPCLDLECNRVDCQTGRILAPWDDGWFKIDCVRCPAPGPTPTPTPSAPPSSPPPGGECPPLMQVGGSMLAPRWCAPGCQRDGYLGYVVNYTATELISADTGLCAEGRLKCEMPTRCQNPEGADIYITLPGKFTDDSCDARSDNPFNCHHKPKADETGVTIFTSCPKGARPSDPRCVSKLIDVRPEGPKEVRSALVADGALDGWDYALGGGVAALVAGGLYLASRKRQA